MTGEQSAEQGESIEESQSDLARLYREMRRKGAGRKQLEKLQEQWAKACMDPMRRGVLRDPPGEHRPRMDGPHPAVEPHRDLGNMLEPNPPSMKDLLKRTQPFEVPKPSAEQPGSES
ncbi:MAG: hypothetical protein ACT4OM_04055 [Actinomycetota bacterium]